MRPDEEVTGTCHLAPLSGLLAQRVPGLPSLAWEADNPPFSGSDEVAATGLRTTPGLVVSIVPGSG